MVNVRKKIYTCTTMTALVASTVLSSVAWADDPAPAPFEDKLLGDVGGERQKLSDAGVDVTLEYKGDFWSVPSGGIKHGGNYDDNLDIKFDFDGEKLFGIKGNKARFWLLNNFGGTPNASRVGSLQAIDNIEVKKSSFRLYEAWVEQALCDDKLSLLVGVHDLNSEFDVTDMSANFIKPTFQIGQAFAGTGKNGPAVFPHPSLAFRATLKPIEDTYVSAGVFDAVPDSLTNQRGTHLHLRSSDGMLLIAEAGYTPKVPDQADSSPDKIAVGAWMYSKETGDLSDVDGAGNPVQRRLAGAYFLSTYQFYHDKAAGEDIGVFFRSGIANGDATQADWDYEVGFVGNGWVPTRPDDEIGIGLSQAHNSNHYMTSVSNAADRNEYGFELYYRDKVMKGVTLQPDLQYIINHGTSTRTKNTTVIGLRLDINF